MSHAKSHSDTSFNNVAIEDSLLHAESILSYVGLEDLIYSKSCWNRRLKNDYTHRLNISLLNIFLTGCNSSSYFRGLEKVAFIFRLKAPSQFGKK